jgi:hypothetical protein
MELNRNKKIEYSEEDADRLKKLVRTMLKCSRNGNSKLFNLAKEGIKELKGKYK